MSLALQRVILVASQRVTAGSLLIDSASGSDSNAFPASSTRRPHKAHHASADDPALVCPVSVPLPTAMKGFKMKVSQVRLPAIARTLTLSLFPP